MNDEDDKNEGGVDKGIDAINAAKRRLLVTDEHERSAREIERDLEIIARIHYRRSLLLIIVEIVIVGVTAREILSCLNRNEPLGAIGIVMLTASVGIAAVLIRRLGSWHRLKKEDNKLRRIMKRIEDERSEAEKITE